MFSTYIYYKWYKHSTNTKQSQDTTPKPEPLGNIHPNELSHGNIVCVIVNNTVMGYLEVNAVAPEGIEAREIDDIQYHIYRIEDISRIELNNYQHIPLLDRLLAENNITNTSQIEYTILKSGYFKYLHDYQTFMRITYGKNITIHKPAFSMN